jgi:cell division protein ZapA
MSESGPVSVQILDKEYTISCPPEEKDALRMREVRDGGKVLGTERIAVMTALNVIHEYLGQKHRQQATAAAIEQDVRRLEQKITSVISRRGEPETVD